MCLSDILSLRRILSSTILCFVEHTNRQARKNAICKLNVNIHSIDTASFMPIAGSQTGAPLGLASPEAASDTLRETVSKPLKRRRRPATGELPKAPNDACGTLEIPPGSGAEPIRKPPPAAGRDFCATCHLTRPRVPPGSAGAGLKPGSSARTAGKP